MTLADTHKGWENEHLATFLLSRISFLGAPLRVGDDFGIDLFATLFEQGTSKKGATVLSPRISIIVQIKSSGDMFDITDKLDYLAQLEMPYYVGVVDQVNLTLALYSARYLPCALSYRGANYQYKLKPVKELIESYREGDEQKGFILLCPHIITLKAAETVEQARSAAQALHGDAAAALSAIASRLNKEYIFEIPAGIEILTGKDSVQTFRESFYKRLAEAFHNIAWMLKNDQSVSAQEIDAFVGVYDALAATKDLPNYLSSAKDKLNALRNQVAS